jgi:hypothetical protein
LKREYLDRRENILLVGPSGTGKTHLATAFGTAACSQGRRVRFFRVTELVTLLLEANEERHLLRLRQQLVKLALLILDELGYVPASKEGAKLLFDAIATAYERNSLIVTTNLPFENWTEVLGSERFSSWHLSPSLGYGPARILAPNVASFKGGRSAAVSAVALLRGWASTPVVVAAAAAVGGLLQAVA